MIIIIMVVMVVIILDHNGCNLFRNFDHGSLPSVVFK